MLWFINELESYPYSAWWDAFSPAECDLIIELMKQQQKTEANLGLDASLDTEVRQANIAWLDFKGNEWIYERVTAVIREANNKFFQYDLSYFEPFQLTYYDSLGAKYKKHVDNFQQAYNNRKLSFSVQLSDPDTYEGCDLVLYASEEGDRMSRQRGRMTIFPSYTLHEVTPLEKGERYALVGWASGPRFK